MFEKRCEKCNRKMGKDFTFCPYCGNNVKKEIDKKNYGFLGKDDRPEFSGFPNLNFGMPFNLNKIFNSLMGQIEKEFQEVDKGLEKNPNKRLPIKSNAISISISTTNGKQPEIKISGLGPEFQKQVSEIEFPKLKEMSEEKIKQLSKLPRKEAETKVRRLSNKIVYEISIPGIKKLEEVIINKLENSIEIKAFSNKIVYFKLLPIKLPLLNYKLIKEKLILEFAEK